jgi:two-component system phosphate regulon sensor histidine kinase PhoR
MDNAYKYSEPGHKSLHIEIVKTGENISFKFIDEGIGISKEDQKHIFQKFYRIENRYNQQGSVGLGLAFCKELVNFMNGSISVKSHLGKGSVFTIQLPYQE